MWSDHLRVSYQHSGGGPGISVSFILIIFCEQETAKKANSELEAIWILFLKLYPSQQVQLTWSAWKCNWKIGKVMHQVLHWLEILTSFCYRFVYSQQLNPISHRLLHWQPSPQNQQGGEGNLNPKTNTKTSFKFPSNLAGETSFDSLHIS